MNKIWPALIFLFLFLFFPSKINAQVVINEFSVNPSDKQDWVELYAIENTDISGWTVGDEAGIFETIAGGTILEPGIYHVVAQYQRLNNDKDTIFLYDADTNVIDSIKYGYEGEVCVSETDGSIARIPDGSNLYDRLSVHTKGFSNGSAITNPCPIPTPEPTATDVPTPQPTSTPRPTATPKPTATPTPRPTVKAVSTVKSEPTPKPKIGARNEEDSDEVILGLRGELSPTQAEEETSAVKGKLPLVAGFFIVGGLGFIGISAYPFLKGRKKRYNLRSGRKEKNIL